ncbi:MAG: 30S ribosomal protein S8 [Pseudomonadota bacterium]
MVVNDPIADMLTRIRNAANAGHPQVSVPHSSLKEAIARIFKDEGFIVGAEVAGEGWRKALIIELKYTEEGQPIFTDLSRTSKLGRRVYIGARDIRPSRQGVGVAILSTSKGVMRDTDAKRQGLGGEVLCTVW